MHGIINRAIEDMAVTTGGPALWQQIREEAGFDQPTFVRTEKYSDDVTIQLVEAAARIFDVSEQEIMERFGRQWIVHTAPADYGPLFAMTETTVPGFLQNVESLHARMRLVLPGMRAPEIRCRDVQVDEDGAGSLHLQYISHRRGLWPVVIGIVKGLGERVRNDVEINRTIAREDGASEYDEFFVRFRPQAA